MYGVPDDWLSARLGFNHGSNDPSYTAFYFFDVDVHHNAVVDQIKRGDTVTLDLRTPATRSTFGFLPSYVIGDVQPDPGHQLTAELRTPGGTGTMRLPVDGRLSSTSDGPDGLPTTTYVQTCDSPRRVRSLLLGIADALGVDRNGRSGVEALPTVASNPGVEQTLTGRTTTFRTEITYGGAKPGYADACVKIVLTYER